jgi:hypothetical protein
VRPPELVFDGGARHDLEQLRPWNEPFLPGREATRNYGVGEGFVQRTWCIFGTMRVIMAASGCGQGEPVAEVGNDGRLRWAIVVVLGVDIFREPSSVYRIGNGGRNACARLTRFEGIVLFDLMLVVQIALGKGLWFVARAGRSDASKHIGLTVDGEDRFRVGRVTGTATFAGRRRECPVVK